MKQKTIRFGLMLVSVIIICLIAIGYYEFTKLQANIYESKSIIAQAQPQIEIARGQRAINNAVAYNVYATSTVNTVLATFPYILALLYLIYKVFDRRGYEEIYK